MADNACEIVGIRAWLATIFSGLTSRDIFFVFKDRFDSGARKSGPKYLRFDSGVETLPGSFSRRHPAPPRDAAAAKGCSPSVLAASGGVS